MPDKENPFCQYAWASGYLGQHRRVAFAKKAAPTRGREPFGGHPSEPFSSTVRPHLWCELVRASGMTKPRNYRYRAACRQLHRPASNHTYDEDEDPVQMWTRYDCEDAKLGAGVMRLYPSLHAEVEKFFKSIGERLEEVLHCTGRIADSMREFAPLEIRRPESCGLSIKFLREALYDPEAETYNEEEYKALKAHLKLNAAQMLMDLRRFVMMFGSEGKGRDIDLLVKMRAEFNRQFAMQEQSAPYVLVPDKTHHDERQEFTSTQVLVGELLKGKAFTRVQKLLGSEDAIEVRVKLTRHHLEMKAWMKSDEGFWPVPVTYTDRVTIFWGVALTRPQFCTSPQPVRVGPQGLAFEVFHEREGRSWLADIDTKEAYESRTCLSGTFSPIQKLRVKLERCWVRDTVKWTIQVEAMINQTEHDLGKKMASVTGSMLRSAFNQVIREDQIDEKQFSNQGLATNLAWILAKHILLTPEIRDLFRKGQVLNAWQTMGKVKDVGMEVGRALMPKIADIIKSKVKDVLAKTTTDVLTAEAMAEVSPITLTGRDTKLLTAKVSFEKGNVGWEPSFGIKYQRSLQAQASLDVPGLLALDSSASLMASWELSEAFDVILGDLVPSSARDGPPGESEKSPEDECFDCMSSPGAVGCISKQGHFTCQEVKQPLKKAIEDKCKQSGGQPIVNVLECQKVVNE
eukprot:gnl/MRDRNA2_/MRDRNA2_173929_c0_seq1.p1 gnl/MRDRNA2_/MRDRNA2_173929_c0~~gnl/MRDRNA2_/MRDRNA2_173929_c0_seq1.p1  ORF type:complete len:736 (+),score=126.01 gnl/MRDRNA2_/MRDRNA2_173929_c0_seq1:152-2209(+)